MNSGILLRNIARISLFVICLMAGGFALISGADFGEGINGLIANAANMLPWVVLAVFLAVAWKSELVGGILITLFGAYIFYVFNFSGPNFFMATFVLTSIVILCGILFIVSHYLQKKGLVTF